MACVMAFVLASTVNGRTLSPQTCYLHTLTEISYQLILKKKALVVIWQDLIRPLRVLHSGLHESGKLKKKSGGRRIIVHFSAADGASITDGISTDQCSLQYITVDAIVPNVSRHGTGALLFKVDIQHAFRNVPVHPENWCMLGMKWNK